MADLLSLIQGIDVETVDFKDTIVDNDYPAPYRVLSESECALAIRVRLDAGWRFKPGAHPYPVEILVLEGTGEFYRDGIASRYEPGAKIFLEPGMQHAFCK